MDEALGRLERAKAELALFCEQNQGVIEQLEHLRAELGSAYEDAKVTYVQHRAKLGPSYGGFSVIQKRSVDANLLVDLKPDAIGVVKFTLSVAELDSLVAEGALEEDIADQVTVIKESITGPKQ